MSWRDFSDGWPGPRIRPEHGLRARSRKGAIGESWWSRRFLEALVEAVDPGRLARGRTYARAGQVIEMKLEPGLVTASVQGSRVQPYATRVKVPVLTARQWRDVTKAMASRAIFLARLLAGEMPQNIEEAFSAAGVRLFQTDRISFYCSCPDSTVCKHVAAVCYLLAESFDDDPFRMFEWRGRSREQLVGELRALRPPLPAEAVPVDARALPAPEPIRAGAEGFWESPYEPADLATSRPTTESDAIFREIDGPTLRLLADAPEALRPLYRSMVAAARDTLWPQPEGRRAKAARRKKQGEDAAG